MIAFQTSRSDPESAVTDDELDIERIELEIGHGK